MWLFCNYFALFAKYFIVIYFFVIRLWITAYKKLFPIVLTSLHFGEYIESTWGKWFYIGMNPYHIIGIIAFSTLIYASLVTGLVWLGMSLFYSMICIYSAALWLMFSMQHRANQECAGRDRRYRPAEINNISFGTGTALENSYTSLNVGIGDVYITKKQVGKSSGPVVIHEPGSTFESWEECNAQSLESECTRNSIRSGDAQISDVREYVEHLRRLRGAQRRSITRASVRRASGSRARARAGFKSTAVLSSRISLEGQQTSKS